MKKLAIWVLVAALVAYPLQAQSDDHLVPLDTARARLAAVTAERHENIEAVEALLSRPAAVQVAIAIGISLEDTKRRLSTPSDEELRDLAARARALRTDPAAGMSTGATILIVVLVVLVAVVIVACVVGPPFCGPDPS